MSYRNHTSLPGASRGSMALVPSEYIKKLLNDHKNLQAELTKMQAELTRTNQIIIAMNTMKLAPQSPQHNNSGYRQPRQHLQNKVPQHNMCRMLMSNKELSR